MNESNTTTQKHEQNYQPKVLCFQVMPGLEPQLYFPILEVGLDAIIIGTVPTGGVSNESKFSFIPFIRKATELGIPVYLLRGSISAVKDPLNSSYRRNMSSIYLPERDAIRAAIIAGGTPLERPDLSKLLEVSEVIRKVYANRPPYNKGIEEVSSYFSSFEFMEDIRRIRQQKY